LNRRIQVQYMLTNVNRRKQNRKQKTCRNYFNTVLLANAAGSQLQNFLKHKRTDKKPLNVYITSLLVRNKKESRQVLIQNHSCSSFSSNLSLLLPPCPGRQTVFLHFTINILINFNHHHKTQMTHKIDVWDSINLHQF